MLSEIQPSPLGHLPGTPPGILTLDSMPTPNPKIKAEPYIGSSTDFTPATLETIRLNSEALNPELNERITKHRQEIIDIVHGNSSKVGIIVGPCSIHNIDEAREYLDRMAAFQHELNNPSLGLGDEVKLIIRLYGEKPRSQNLDSMGVPYYRGHLAHPNPFLRPDQILDENGVNDFAKLMQYAYEKDLAIATEFLNMEAVERLAHLPSLVVVGARTVNQTKFLNMAKALPHIPIGFKNSTDGRIDEAIDATRQTDNGFLILRGGKSGPNWDATNRLQANIAMDHRNMNRALCVDACHDNSGKSLNSTRAILDTVASDMIQPNQLPPGFIMIESNLIEGKQDINGQLVRGQSITDPCLGIEETIAHIRQIAQARKAARLN